MDRPAVLRMLPFVILALLVAMPAAAQGLLVDVRADAHIRLPRPIPMPQPAPSSYKIASLEVNAKLTDQIARVQVAQTFENTGSQQMEVAFVFPLPYDGAIDQLTLMVDGKEYEAKLLTKEEARRRYEEIVRKNRDPALLEWVGTGMFQTSVFPIPPGAKRTVTLRYSQLCRQSHGLTDFQFPLSTAKYTAGPLEKLSIRLAIDSRAPIKNVYSATHDVKIDRPDGTHAVINYHATNILPGEDFRLFYDSGDASIGASVVSYRPQSTEDGKLRDIDSQGYFLLLASPEIKSADAAPIAKSVVFIVDRSGSMSGEKIEQAKGALKFVLNNLREGDLFNIVAYDSAIETFRPELQKFGDDTRSAALGFVDGLYAGGSTNIDAALRRGLDMLTDSARPTYVIFLTDGLPTEGEMGESAIVHGSEVTNKVRARVFAFGVGYDVNSRLLDKLARANFGQSEYVRPSEDIEASVSKLYNRIGAPVMTDVTASFTSDAVNSGQVSVVNRLYPKGPFDLFAGDQVLLVGRYRVSGAAKVTLTGKVGGKEQSFDFRADLVEQSDDDTNAFVAKLWATRRVGEIIDEIDLKGKNDELVNELVTLATVHGILTPYTSFLADETSDVRAVTQNLDRAKLETESLAESTGRFGFQQRAVKLSLQSASRAPAEAAAPAWGGEFGGGGGGYFGGNVDYFDVEQDMQVAANNIRQIGRKTFFQRGKQWIDSSVSDEDEKKVHKIERYSREYFDLVERHGKQVAQYLALDEPILIKLDGTTYQW